MTLLPDIKSSETCCGVGGGGISSSSGSDVGSESGSRCCVTMNCCTTAASSDMSIDEDVSSTSSATVIASQVAAAAAATNTKAQTTKTIMGTTKVNNDLHAYRGQDHFYDTIETDFPRCAKIDIDFEDVKYTVRRFSFAERKFVAKEILHGINGSFRSGELTAIMGPSGCGKSTLLNVMSGFRATGVTGNICVNGKQISTHSERFRKLSCYIHQDDLLRPQLTVGETMLLAAHLKLGFNVTKEHKLNLIKHILMLLGLEHHYNVFTAKLSGGQKKRLAIALELISNPPVLYLDEPTTGLDSSSCSQCVGLLKKLASQGHTIVCTIHQPSALIFEMFDKLYTVTDGNCMYQGPVRELVPFLAEQQLICPSYHNPADYLLEVAVGEHERDLNKLIYAANKKYYEDAERYQYMQNNDNVRRLITTIQENIENKTCNWQLEMQTLAGTKQNKSDSNLPTVALSTQFAAFDYVKPAADDLALEEIKALNGQKQPRTVSHADVVAPATDSSSCEHVADIKAASFGMQYLLLLQRILICARRNYFLLLARLISHILIGVLFGYLYMSVGDKATTVLGNYVYLYGTTLLLVYTGKMAVVLTFPLELGMLTREHFNRWYKLGPYFLSLISFEIPFQSFCAVLYILISVYLTGNNSAESFRVYYFILLGVLATLSAQAWGFFVGATLPTKLAVFLGPILAVLFSVFGFCSRYVDITPAFRWMWHISYFRAGFHGALNAIYGLDRQFLHCPENVMYCHFRSPKVFLNYMMITDVRMSDCVTLMSIVIGVMHLLTLITLWHKLNKR